MNKEKLQELLNKLNIAENKWERLDKLSAIRLNASVIPIDSRTCLYYFDTTNELLYIKYGTYTQFGAPIKGFLEHNKFSDDIVQLFFKTNDDGKFDIPTIAGFEKNPFPGPNITANGFKMVITERDDWDNQQIVSIDDITTFQDLIDSGSASNPAFPKGVARISLCVEDLEPAFKLEENKKYEFTYYKCDVVKIKEKYDYFIFNPEEKPGLCIKYEAEKASMEHEDLGHIHEVYDTNMIVGVVGDSIKSRQQSYKMGRSN